MFRQVGWFLLGIVALGWCSACKSDPYNKPPDTTLTSPTKGTGLSTAVPGTHQSATPQRTQEPRAIPVARSTGQSGLEDTELLLRPVKVGALPSISFDKKKKKSKKKRRKAADLSFGVGGLKMDPSMKGLMGTSGSLLGGGSLSLSTGSSGKMNFNDDDDDDSSTAQPSLKPESRPSTLPTSRVVVAPTSQPVLVKGANPTSHPTSVKVKIQQPKPLPRRLVRVSSPPTRMGGSGLSKPWEQTHSKTQALPLVLARVNDEPADRWSFLQLVKEMQRLLAWKQGMPVGSVGMKLLRKQALKRLIDHLLLYQKALQEGVQLTPLDEQKGLRLFLSRFPKRITLRDYLIQENMKRKAFMERLRRQLIVRKYMMKLSAGIPFSRQKVKAFYKKYFSSPSILAKQIVIPIVKNDVEAAKLMALHVLKLAQKPNANFVALVKKYSHDPSKELNGDIGELKKGDLLPALEQVLFSLQKGQVGGPVQTDLGFHILKVVSRKEPQSLARMQIKIVKQMQMKKLAKLLKKQLAELRSEGQVDILVPWGKE